MSDQIPTPADVAPKSDPESIPSGAAPTPPPWGEDFDPEKAWGKIQALSKDLEKAKADKTPQAEKDAQAIAALRRKLDEAAPKLAEYDKVLDSQKTAEQKAQDAAAAAEKRAQALVDRATRAEIKALAADGFADPTDAIGALDTSKYVTPEGDVDTESIKSDLADLLTRKPHWAKAPSSRVPAPNPAQGASGSGSPASQLTRTDLAKMSPQEIVKAREDGRLDNLLKTGGK